MKKLLMTMLAVLTCGAVQALPVGNPSEASLLCDGVFWCGNGDGCCDPCNPCGNWCDSFSFRAGFYGDYVFQRFLRNDKTFGTNNRSQLDHSRINTNAAYLAVNFCNRFDVFATLGMSNIFLEGNISSFSPSVILQTPIVTTGSRIELETRTEFSWSVGGRITIWECGCTNFGIEGQYFRTDPRVIRVTWAALASNYPGATSPFLRARWSEWQVGLGVSHRINILVPYIAVKWSGQRLKWENNPNVLGFPVDSGAAITFNNLRNRKYWGYAVGVSLVDCAKAAVTVEGRFADEWGLYVNGQIRF